MSATMNAFTISGANIFDGTGAPPRRGDVAVADGVIVAVGEELPNQGEVIDGGGLALAPGFIDAHTHDDFAAVIHPDMAFKTRGGVTTCVVGNCGMGAAPWPVASVGARGFHPQPLPEWSGYHGYFAYLDAHPAAVNIAALVGLGTAREAVMGNAARAPSADELIAIKDIVREGLDAGAVGVSSGLMYDPGRFATTDELVDITSVMRGSGIYATHMRDEGPGLVQSVEEAIEIGRRSGIAVQISHHKAAGKSAWGLVRESLRLIEAAQATGIVVHSDQYPYTAGSTLLWAVYRDGTFGGTGMGLITADDVVLASVPEQRDWEGKSVAAIATSLGLPAEAAAEEILRRSPHANVIMHMMCEDDVRTVMRHPSTMIGSDGIPAIEGRPHPRLYNTFARVLGHYARDERLFAMAEAVYRMTGLSAAKFGFADRGVIRVGARADLVLFDAATIIDRGTFADPKQSPAGIVRVYVNGQLTVIDGEATGVRAGHVLRRQSASA